METRAIVTIRTYISATLSPYSPCQVICNYVHNSRGQDELCGQWRLGSPQVVRARGSQCVCALARKEKLGQNLWKETSVGLNSI